MTFIAVVLYTSWSHGSRRSKRARRWSLTPDESALVKKVLAEDGLPTQLKAARDAVEGLGQDYLAATAAREAEAAVVEVGRDVPAAGPPGPGNVTSMPSGDGPVESGQAPAHSQAVGVLTEELARRTAVANDYSDRTHRTGPSHQARLEYAPPETATADGDDRLSAHDARKEDQPEPGSGFEAVLGIAAVLTGAAGLFGLLVALVIILTTSAEHLYLMSYAGDHVDRADAVTVGGPNGQATFHYLAYELTDDRPRVETTFTVADGRTVSLFSAQPKLTGKDEGCNGVQVTYAVYGDGGLVVDGDVDFTEAGNQEDVISRAPLEPSRTIRLVAELHGPAGCDATIDFQDAKGYEQAPHWWEWWA